MGNKLKIVTILGARPQFIKAANISRTIAKYPNIQEVIVHTGQHYDANMSAIFFEEMQIPKPDYFLGVGGLSHGAMTGQMIEKIEKVLLQEDPDFAIVYGDTNTTLAGAIVASKTRAKLVHIEAGLRSNNRQMPEETNRILTDRISDYLFCPTDTAIQNLKQEGFEHFNCRVIKSGDVMQDSAHFYSSLARKPEIALQKNFMLATFHRAENTDNQKRLSQIIEALNYQTKQTQIVVPLHPRTRAKIEEYQLNTEFTTIDPVGYLEMVWLLKHCSLVITDSGGLQKEAFFFHKPCLTLRDETEWVELIEHNFNLLVGADKESILTGIFHEFNADFSIDLYGSGQASERIIEELLKN